MPEGTSSASLLCEQQELSTAPNAAPKVGPGTGSAITASPRGAFTLLKMVPHSDPQNKQTEFLKVQVLQVSKSPRKFSRNEYCWKSDAVPYHEGIWNAVHTSLTHSTVSGYFCKIYILSNKICVAMGHLFMFLCELIITLEFLLSTEMVEFYSERINKY